MSFQETVVNYLKEHGVTVNRVEAESDFSIVCHVPQSDNITIANLKDTMEPVLGVVMVQSDSFGMNVVVIEKEEDEEDE